MESIAPTWSIHCYHKRPKGWKTRVQSSQMVAINPKAKAGDRNFRFGGYKIGCSRGDCASILRKCTHLGAFAAEFLPFLIFCRQNVTPLPRPSWELRTRSLNESSLLRSQRLSCGRRAPLRRRHRFRHVDSRFGPPPLCGGGRLSDIGLGWCAFAVLH